MTPKRNDRSPEGARGTLAALSSHRAGRAVRRSSTNEFLGLPWYSIAVGPDLAKGELRGHARGVIAVGDIATGSSRSAAGRAGWGGLATGLF